MTALVLPAAAFHHCRLVEPGLEEGVRRCGSLAGDPARHRALWGDPPERRSPHTWGAFAWEAAIAHSGWYVWRLDGGPGPDPYTARVDGRLLAARAMPDGRVGAIHLTAGTHLLELERMVYWWGGFGAITGLRLVPAETPADRLRIDLADCRDILRLGEAATLAVSWGGPMAARLTLRALDDADGTVAAQVAIDLPAGDGLHALTARLEPARPGFFRLEAALDGAPLALPLPALAAIDAAPAPAGGPPPGRTLLADIDCAAAAPDHASGVTRVVRQQAGAYRESGPLGYRCHQDASASWFAYTIATSDLGRPHVVEFDYPDDAQRTFVVAVRDPFGADATPASGVDSGGCWPLSHRVHTRRLLVWPRHPELRAVFLAAYDGMRAAVARIRVWRLDGEPALPDLPAGGRSFANWFEEGGTLYGIYGGIAKGGSLRQALAPTERWVRAVAAQGGDLVVPTFAIYQFAHYPSAFNTTFCHPGTDDQVRLMLLCCERYRVGMVAEFHPEARELRYPLPDGGDPAILAVGREGQRSPPLGGPPEFNPLHPRVRAWTAGMIAEFCARYRDSPAFRGVSLRAMGWKNAGLFNLHSLDWGYDDATLDAFAADSGLAVPGAGAERAPRAHAWLMAHAREAWIAWRCRAVAALHRELAAVARGVRPDLVVQVNISELGGPLREAGLDPALLSAIPGLQLVDATCGYGRFWEQDPQAARDRLLDPERATALRGADGAARFLFAHQYFEATEPVAHGRDLGWPQATGGWISGVVNPAGPAALERYALALADADALQLGDGGNSSTLAGDEALPFMREFRRLPAVPFRARPDIRDPVAAWEQDHDGRFWFYLVNREPWAIDCTLRLAGADAVERLGTGERLPLRDGALGFAVQPFELAVFRAPAGTALLGLAAAAPSRCRRRLERRVAAVGRLADAVAASAIALPAAQAAHLAAAFAESCRAAAEGRWWRARTVLETRPMRDIYEATLVRPPGLDDLGTPTPPEGAQDAAALARAASWLRAEPAAPLLPAWPDGAVAVGAAEGGELPLDAEVDARFRLRLGLLAGGRFGRGAGLTLADGRSLDLEAVADEGAADAVLLHDLQLAAPLVLPRGRTGLRLRGLGGDRLGLGYLALEPLFTPLPGRRWSLAGPWPAGDLPAAPPAIAGWRRGDGDGPRLDLAEGRAVTGGEIVCAATWLRTERPCRVRLRLGVDYWARAWIGEAPILDLGPQRRPGGAPRARQFTVDLDLAPGWNRLLIAVAAGSRGHGLWAEIGEPGLELAAAAPA